MAKKGRATSSRTSESAPRNFVAIADAYAAEAIADRKGRKFGKWVKLAAKRYIADRKRAGKRGVPFTWDAQEAAWACEFIEQLPHVEGIWDTPTIVLHPSHVFFVVQLFGFRRGKHRRFTSALFAVARKNAKALALDTPIPTPSGWSTMGDLAVGDAVFGSNGRPCSVTAVSPIYVDHDCYRLKFSNGEDVVADAGHRWLTWARSGGASVRTTAEIAATLKYGARGDTNHSIRMPSPLDGEEVDLPIAPYTLGAWLGDGHSAVARITCDREDAEIIEGIRADGWPVREKYCNGSRASTFVISDGDRSQKARDKSFAALLRAQDLIDNKHIPAAYLRGSFPQRLALLQGLMDTDGTVSKNGRVISFTSTSELLARGVAELLASFGLKYSWRRERLVCNGREVPGTGHKLQFMAFRDRLPVFRLQRKLNRMRMQSGIPRSRTVQIVAAEKVASVPVKCIAVDAPNHLFLFGKTMLPTHNSTLAAGILLYCLCCEPEVGPQVISAATTGDQARIIFNVAKRMVEKTPDLREAFTLQAFANAIARLEVGGSLKPINAKASTQDGLNPSHVALDEIHAHKTHDLLNVITSAAGARASPLFLYTTTEGYENPGPWGEIRHFAQQILSGAVEADHFLALFYAIDEADDEFNEACWPKANPLIDVNPSLAEAIRKESVEAKAMPGKHGEFKIKRCNRQSAAATAWIDIGRWKKCAGPVDLDELQKHPCTAAIDLSSTRDLTSARFVWNIDGRYYTWGRRWVPAWAVAQRTQRGTVPYAAWIEAGLITQTDGDAVDYAEVERTLRADFERFKPTKIAFDRWNAQDLCNRLTDDQFPMVEFIQGTKSYHPAMQELERAYVAGQLNHGGDPVLQWCAANLVPRFDANMNMAPDKRRSPEKIDDMAALLMAIGVSIVPGTDMRQDYRLLTV